MQAAKFLGIEIGGTKLQMVTGNADGSLLSSHRFNVNKEDGAEGIRNNITTVLAEYKTETIAAIGVGFGGPVNRQKGRVETSFHIEGWSGFAIADWLGTLMRVPVFIDNDANVAALGEATYGAGRDYRHVLYITLGSGVGGGLVVNRQIYYGAIPGEVEIGHIRMDRKGTTLESLCSGWAVDNKIRGAVAANPQGILAQRVKGIKQPEAVFLKEAIEAGDDTARQIFEQTTEDFAFGLSHAIHLLHPEVVVLGGGLSLMGDMLQQSVEKKLPNYLMKAFAPGPPVKLAELREKAVPLGCLALCNQQLIK
ncbi:MAG TPA: ROK family protein [Flavisolibacter sp.]|nr:ROK family protein [Flavisolibacter sp.]